SVESAAAAYNGGPTAAQRWLDGGGLPEETDRYRRYVAGMWSERREARSATFQAWCRNGGWRMVAPYSCGDA
ncbi:MAG: hypothetical protein ACE5EL_06205, partial [Anaerolineae bacterium]